MLKPSVPLSLTLVQHKLGADRTEKFLAIPVKEDNRLVHKGPPQEIQVWQQFKAIERIWTCP